MGQHQRFPWAEFSAPFRRSEKCFWVGIWRKWRKIVTFIKEFAIIFLTRVWKPDFFFFFSGKKTIFHERKKDLFVFQWFVQSCFGAQNFKESLTQPLEIRSKIEIESENASFSIFWREISILTIPSGMMWIICWKFGIKFKKCGVVEKNAQCQFQIFPIHFQYISKKFEIIPKLFQNIPKYSKFLQNIPNFPKYFYFFQNIPNYSKIFQNIPNRSKVFQNIPKYSKTFQNIPLTQFVHNFEMRTAICGVIVAPLASLDPLLKKTFFLLNSGRTRIFQTEERSQQFRHWKWNLHLGNCS